MIVSFYEIQNKIKLKSFERKIQEIGQKFHNNYNAVNFLRKWRLRVCMKKPQKRKEYSSLLFHEYKGKFLFFMKLKIFTLSIPCS